MSNVLPTIQVFDSAFVAQYPDAFDELLLLGHTIGQRAVDGKESRVQYSKAKRLLSVLEALDNPELTAPQIEALEYCLIQLAESKFTPTIEVVTDLDPLPEPVVPGTDYNFYGWLGEFSLTGQDVTFTYSKHYVMNADVGAFTLTGKDAGFIEDPYTGVHRTMDASVGSFTLTGQATTFSLFTGETYSLEAELHEAVAGTPSWTVKFNAKVITLTGDGDTGSGLITAHGDVNCVVYKTSNGGYTEDSGSVDFTVDSVNVDTQTFSIAQYKGASSPIVYTFTGLSGGETLGAIITEG